jgi:hypothetical protein
MTTPHLLILMPFSTQSFPSVVDSCFQFHSVILPKITILSLITTMIKVMYKGLAEKLD